jgi:2-polyprenyl-3-methyl-5-hydroxy-6-metoxy-1,4-benzoquinol methylase
MSKSEYSLAVPERLIPGTLAWDLYSVEHRQRYDWASQYCRNQVVLDVACGVGYGSEILSRNVAKQVVAIDISYDALQRTNGSRALFAAGDVSMLPLADRTFDVVVSFETIEHVASPEALLAEVSRVLKPGGLCICSSPNRDFMPTTGEREVNPYHISEMSYDEFRAVFEKHFEISEQFSQTHSPAYLRHLELLRAIDARLKPIRFSRLMRWEKKLRNLLGKESWNGLEGLPAEVTRAVPGDFVIEPLDQVTPNLLTLILVGRKRPS